VKNVDQVQKMLNLNLTAIWKVCILCIAMLFVFYTDVDSLTYRSCRAEVPSGKLFTIDVCSAGQVMNIQSAVAGYSRLYTPLANPPQCNSSECIRSITPHVAAHCQGRQTCSFLQQVLLYPRDGVGALCSLSRDGNFISVELTCITSAVFFNVFSIILR